VFDGGRVEFVPHMVFSDSKDAAVKRVRESFARDNVYGGGESGPLAELEDTLDFGMREGREEAIDMYDKACSQAAKKTARQGGAASSGEKGNQAQKKEGSSREDTPRAGFDDEQVVGTG
jgi:hypothetical protein